MEEVPRLQLPDPCVAVPSTGSDEFLVGRDGDEHDMDGIEAQALLGDVREG